MAEEDVPDYQLIDPTSFDLIVVGTGLPESMIAAASSAAGKSVLHLDPNSFYGSHYSSLPLDDLISFLQSQQPDDDGGNGNGEEEEEDGGEEFLVLDLKPRSMFTDVEITPPEEEVLGPSRKFSLDLSGPRVLFCGEPVVDHLLNSGANHHIEFKSIDASFVYSGSGEEDGKFKLSTVPDSRSAIFRDKSLGLIEKNQLMRFFKLVQEHFESRATGGIIDGEEKRRISDEDLESPFVEFLTKQRLPQKIKSIILYAIAMSDYDQDCPELCKKNLLKTKDGIKSLGMFHSSVGRFNNASGALIYPIYGQGELPQAFCRCAAVKGALYVLRMPVTALLMHKDSSQYKGVRLASGQELFSHQLVVGPSVAPLPSMSPVIDSPHKSSEGVNLGEIEAKVVRGICITRSSIRPDLSNLLVIFPPRSLYSEQVTSVRALQLGSSLAVCPSGLYVVYLSTICDDAIQGKASLQAAMNILLAHPVPESAESSIQIQAEGDGEIKPTLLWSSMYVQELQKGSSRSISLCPMPDGNLDYRDILESTVKLFHKIYPEEAFFPERKVSENVEEGGSTSD